MKDLTLTNLNLLPGNNSSYEKEMAKDELRSFSDEELVKRSAFFSHINEEETHLYQLCKNNKILVRGKNRMQYFEKFRFKTGYASHGLFPYRGKFHPQLVRSLINTFHLKNNSLIYDPMGGSGTTAVESNLMGIDAITSDVNPFCTFMIKVKAESLKMSIEELNAFIDVSSQFYNNINKPFSQIEEIKFEKTINDLFTLAYLDTMGYQKRSTLNHFGGLFRSVTKRYFETLSNFISTREKLKLEIGKSRIFTGDARRRILNQNLVDAIITSPPYSFAIDYVKGDKENIIFLKRDPNDLYSKVIGLRGISFNEKIQLYFDDMDKIGENMYDVLKDNGKIALVIGNNTNQTGGIKLSSEIITIFKKIGFKLDKIIKRPLTGLNNKMKTELIQVYSK